MRDAIVLSGWGWENCGTPERICLALSSLGAKVLHCEPPVSVFRAQKHRPLRELKKNIYGLQLQFLSSRAMEVPIVRELQANAMCRQIRRAALAVNLRRPILMYSWLSNLFPVAAQISRDHKSIHLCLDYTGVDPNYDRYVEVSDLTLAIPKTCYHRLKAKFGEKVMLLSQPVDCARIMRQSPVDGSEPAELIGIPRPRLGYSGPALRRLNMPLLVTLLQNHPEWHFVSVGSGKVASLPNVHALPRVSPEALWGYAQGFDVGFMPYDCYDGFNLHCVPLKLFEYFALGIPVVSTPIINLWEYKNLVYFGDTAEELARAVAAALNEPVDSPKRAMRMEIARKHSIENLAMILHQCLSLDDTVLH
jgi:glycosyltransferase involved in cell wall biosynthesis